MLFCPPGRSVAAFRGGFPATGEHRGGPASRPDFPGKRLERKNWPGERFREVAAWLEEKRRALVGWIGSAKEASLVENDPLPGKNWFGRFSISELAAVMKRASLWLGNDSGPMHLAAAVGCPTVSLWGPTEPGKWAPRGGKTATSAGWNAVRGASTGIR